MATRDVEFRLKFSNDGLVRVIDQTGREVEDLQREFNKLDDTQRRSFDNLTKKVRQNNRELVTQGKQLKANKGQFSEFGDEVVSKFEEAGDAGGTFQGLLTRLGTRGGVVGGIIAGSIAVVVGSFLEAEGAALKFQDRLAGIQLAARQALGGVAGIVRSIFIGLTGDTERAAAELANALLQFDGLGETADQGTEAARALRAVRIETARLAKEQAEGLAEVEILRARAGEDNRSIAERIGLIQRAASIEADFNTRRAELLERQAQALRDQTLRINDQPEKLQEVLDIEAQAEELRASNRVLAVSTETEVNELLREQQELRESILDNLREFSAIYTGQEVELGIQKQIESLQELRSSIVDSGIAEAGSDQVKQIENAIEALQRRLREGLPSALDELPNQIEEGTSAALDALQNTGSDFRAEGLRIGQEITVGIAQGIEESGNVLEQLSADQAAFVRDQFTQSFASIGDIVVSSFDAQVQALDSVIQKQEERVSELEQQLEQERELQEEGKANNVAILEERLASEQEVLERNRQEQLEAKKRAANAELVVNAALQASETTLAVTKLLNSGASGGVVGLVIAAAAVATLFSIIAQAKANAVNAAEPPQFAEGTEWLGGKPHSAGGTVIEAEYGERILSRRDKMRSPYSASITVPPALCGLPSSHSVPSANCGGSAALTAFAFA